LTGLQTRFVEEVVPVVRGYFYGPRHYYRLVRPDRHEDVLQDALANAWQRCLRMHQLGKPWQEFLGHLVWRSLQDALRGTSVTRQRQTGQACVFNAWGRRLCRRLSWHRRTQGLYNTSYYVEESSAEIAGARRNREDTPERAAVRLDIDAWLTTLPQKQRLAAELLMRGNRLDEACQLLRVDVRTLRR
jgi:DNA-directed RNA polymerase specialized sigma24 family protein